MSSHDVKVCIVAASLRSLGGQSIQAADLIVRFAKDSLAVGFLAVDPMLPEAWRKLQRIKYLRTVITWPLYIKHLITELPRFNVLHLFSASYLSFLLAPTPAVIIGKLFRKKVILNYHSGEAEDHLKRSSRIIRAVLSLADHLVVPSTYLQNIFNDFGIMATVIPNVVDTDVFRYYRRHIYRPRFIVSRTLEPLYNVRCAIKAFRVIQDQIPDAVLTILGSGSQEEELKALAVSLKLRNINFIGRVERKEIASYYFDHDVMLNASNIDNMPLSILEAFASGLPVVTTAAGGIPYLVKGDMTGILVPLNDHIALADAVLRLLSDQELAGTIAQNAYDEVKNYYSWDVVRNQWLKLYGKQ